MELFGAANTGQRARTEKPFSFFFIKEIGMKVSFRLMTFNSNLLKEVN